MTNVVSTLNKQIARGDLEWNYIHDVHKKTALYYADMLSFKMDSWELARALTFATKMLCIMSHTEPSILDEDDITNLVKLPIEEKRRLVFDAIKLLEYYFDGLDISPHLDHIFLLAVVLVGTKLEL